MFGMGFMEMLFIAVIAVLFLGPEKLPQAMVDVARFFKKMKGTIATTKEELERELSISDLKAEMMSYKSQLEDMSNEVKSIAPQNMITDEVNSIKDVINDTKDEIETTVKPQPTEVVTFQKKKTSIQTADTDEIPSKES